MSAKVYYPTCWAPRKRAADEKPPVESPPLRGAKFFRCLVCLRDYRDVRLTGRTADMGPQPWNARLDRIARQYRCPCGHVGWSQCEDLRFAKGAP